MFLERRNTETKKGQNI